MNNTNTFLIIVAFCFALLSCKHKVYDVDMVYIPSGDFLMGSEDVDADLDERPIHSVHVKEFYLGKYEVTQKLWKAVMVYDPAYHRGLDYPVECVSWDDCQKFIKKLNQITGKNYRLPTEAEWEYVASMSYKKMEKEKFTSYVWCLKSVEKPSRNNITSHKVGSLKSDCWGIYDLIGNVNEWCADSYNSLAYQNNCQQESDIKVFKGGCFANEEKFLRPANRNHINRYTRHYTLGLRLAMDVTP